MKTLAATLGLGGLLLLCGATGCTGHVSTDPDVQVTQLQLHADHLGALKAAGCVNLHGLKGCSPYPNPLQCERMDIRVMGDGRTCADCRVGRETRSLCGGFTDGIPILCNATEETGCHQCVDVYGNTMYDSCNRNTQLYRGPQVGNGWDQLPNGSGYLTEPDDGSGTKPNDKPQTPPDTTKPDDKGQPTPPKPDDTCSADKAREKYAEILNKILVQEGLGGLKYQPLLGKKLNLGGLWSWLGIGMGLGRDACKYWLNSSSYMTQCWNNSNPAKCHCRCTNGSAGRQTCRCGRIGVDALRRACQQIPPGCDYKTWVAAYMMEHGAAGAWLNTASYTGGFFGSIPFMPKPPDTVPPDTKTPPNNNTPPGSNIPPTCLGSPLVLDLGDDGIAPTAPERGVAFDLLGSGAQRTAWVRGDDALLVLDRDGNGRIDNGSELFGEATDLGGAPAADGFQALALLDRPDQGGNGNGLIEPGDLMFGELRLWTDRDGDGVSRPSELQTLAAAGVSYISLQYTNAGGVADAHGNDLSLRGSFARADGRTGLMVDVLFRLGGKK